MPGVVRKKGCACRVFQPVALCCGVASTSGAACAPHNTGTENPRPPPDASPAPLPKNVSGIDGHPPWGRQHACTARQRSAPVGDSFSLCAAEVSRGTAQSQPRHDVCTHIHKPQSQSHSHTFAQSPHSRHWRWKGRQRSGGGRAAATRSRNFCPYVTFD